VTCLLAVWYICGLAFPFHQSPEVFVFYLRFEVGGHPEAMGRPFSHPAGKKECIVWL
jgi:hypothetical protein